MAKRREVDKLSELLANFNGDLLGDELPRQFTDDSIKVERIVLDLVRPDPVQPRRVLPDRVHHAFHNSQLTPSQALREVVQIAQVAARQRGRPFSNLLELLPDPERDEEPDIKLTPEELLLRDLVNLAVTIRDDGQVNPITVIDVTQGVIRMYRIETGERRYWAAWLLRDFLPGYEGDGMLDCIVVPATSATVFRQAKENTARSGLSAVAMARQAALLLLYVHGYEIPTYPVTNDFYRQALELDMRGKREYTDVILTAMGGIEKTRFSRYKALLHLSDEALEIADRYNIDEARLRHLVQLGSEDQVEMLRQIIQFDLTRQQVRELIEGGVPSSSELTSEAFSRPLIQLAKIMKAKDLPPPENLARYLILQEQNAKLALARLQTLRQLLDDTERYLSD